MKMMKNLFNKKNLVNFFLCIFFLILIIITLNFIYNKSEGFGTTSTSALAFERPTLRRWMFATSRNAWYRVVRSNMFQTSTLGFTDRNTRFSISFLYTCSSGSTTWRNIFRFSNRTNDTDGSGTPESRVPGLWIHPDNTNRFHFRLASDTSWNDGFDTAELPFGDVFLVTFVIDGPTVNYYLNNI
jgi:hypothetical protein